MDVGVGPHGNSVAWSKYATFEQLEIPSTCANLHMLIKVFVFYRKHLLLYKIWLRPWGSVLAKEPRPGEVTQAEGQDILASHWTAERDDLLTNLKQDVLSGLVLARPEPR